MAFGQPSGPQAPARQVAELLELLHEAGHTDFRDARGPMGFTQRQAGGKFTREEVDSFIARLQAEAESAASSSASQSDAASTGATASVTGPSDRRSGRLSAGASTARRLSDDALATELRRRGWEVIEPSQM
jgi:hypothetical protein